MSTRTEAVAPWHWVTTKPLELPAKSSHQELWAGAVYLMVWSVLWLAVIVTVLAPLDTFVGGAR
ncbi:MAG: hypothetical protein ABW133_09940 [Polyangiaceae bacterium]